jgi:hypothetical protein
MTDIITPVIYNQEKWYRYGVDRKTGDIYSKHSGSWKKMSFRVSGKSPYPAGSFSVGGDKQFIVQHIAVHETLNPSLPIPPGITQTDWKRTPANVKKMLRHVWQVNHIDHCHTNANPKNLEWVTGKQNMEAYKRYRIMSTVDDTNQKPDHVTKLADPPQLSFHYV